MAKSKRTSKIFEDEFGEQNFDPEEDPTPMGRSTREYFLHDGEEGDERSEYPTRQELKGK